MNRGIIEHEKRLAVAAMAVLLIVLFFVLICVGRYPISPLRAFEIIGNALLGNQEGMDIYESLPRFQGLGTATSILFPNNTPP